MSTDPLLELANNVKNKINKLISNAFADIEFKNSPNSIFINLIAVTTNVDELKELKSILLELNEEGIGIEINFSFDNLNINTTVHNNGLLGLDIIGHSKQFKVMLSKSNFDINYLVRTMDSWGNEKPLRLNCFKVCLLLENDFFRKYNFYKYAKIGEHKFYCLGEYYPKNSYNDDELATKDIVFRKALWDFMSGGSAKKNAFKIAQLLIPIFGEEKLSEMKLCIIPSQSTAENIIKYYNFCQRLCIETGLINGYSDIQNSKDLEGNYDYTQMSDTLDNISINGGVKGYNIILFKDLVLQWKPFAQIADKLIELGAKSVTGLFLGKVTSKKKNDISYRIEDIEI